MHIGFDFRMGGNINSGIGRYVFELLEHVATQNTADEYTVFYNKHNVAEQDLIALQGLKNVKLVSTAARHYSLAEQTSFLRALNRENLDLVHFPNFNVPIRYNKPYIVTIHDMVHHKISGHKKSHYFHFQAYKYIIRRAAMKAQRIITVSQASKNDIVKYLGVDPDKIRVIYEAPSLVTQPPQRLNEVRRKFYLARPYFLFVGTLERKKNIVALTRGFDALLTKHLMEVDLVIAGKADPHYPDIKHEAMDIVHHDRLVFTDFVSDEDLSALYQGAYAFITASLHEGFGLPGVEAMQFGIPILASNTEVLNVVYDDAAFYFDPLNPGDIAEKMYLLARDSRFHQQMQEKSFRRAQLYNWGKAAEQTLEVYREAAAKGPDRNFEFEHE
jgi:glycosyltransferase involved in cell wall biosynthesis